MTAATCPPPPMTNALRRSITTWRLRRSHRARTARVTELLCSACRRWQPPHRFARNTPVCRACADD
ncbi:hypothetical protein HCB17_02845 [Salinispora arenicola]|uniref:hypothetical protein n=1 Tax=Salinispora arenicola TaxID=168697 RepID=UPI001430E8B4|nr:hypothetical protein [Salinispora arenicola]NIL40223.1 hypothetical protein [Salinispora arenicola]